MTLYDRALDVFEAEAKVEADKVAHAHANPGTGTGTDTEPNPDSNPGTKTDPNPDLKPDPNPDPNPSLGPNSDPNPSPSQAQAQAATRGAQKLVDRAARITAGLWSAEGEVQRHQCLTRTRTLTPTLALASGPRRARCSGTSV